MTIKLGDILRDNVSVEVRVLSGNKFPVADPIFLRLLSSKLQKDQPVTMRTFEDAPAVIYVVDKNKVIKYITNKFFLTGVNQAMQEKVQIIETFGAAEYLFFGEKERIYSFTGYLLEADSFDTNEDYLWETSFIDLYNNVLRGTKLAEKKYEVILTYKNTILHGYILSLNLISDAGNPNHTVFSFNMLVRKQETTKLSDEGGFDAVDTLNDIVKELQDAEEILEKAREDLELNLPEVASNVIRTVEENEDKSVEEVVSLAVNELPSINYPVTPIQSFANAKLRHSDLVLRANEEIINLYSELGRVVAVDLPDPGTVR